MANRVFCFIIFIFFMFGASIFFIFPYIGYNFGSSLGELLDAFTYLVWPFRIFGFIITDCFVIIANCLLYLTIGAITATRLVNPLYFFGIIYFLLISWFLACNNYSLIYFSSPAAFLAGIFLALPFYISTYLFNIYLDKGLLHEDAKKQQALYVKSSFILQSSIFAFQGAFCGILLFLYLFLYGKIPSQVYDEMIYIIWPFRVLTVAISDITALLLNVILYFVIGLLTLKETIKQPLLATIFYVALLIWHISMRKSPIDIFFKAALAAYLYINMSFFICKCIRVRLDFVIHLLSLTERLDRELGTMPLTIENKSDHP